MDFGKELMARQSYGAYEEFDATLLPPLYIAYRNELSEGSEVLHSNLRYRYKKGEPELVEAMQFWADLTVRARDLLVSGDRSELGPLLDANFDMRRRICPISEANLRMVETARQTGASAKFTGSGGALIGTYDSDAVLQDLVGQLGAIGVDVIKPML